MGTATGETQAGEALAEVVDAGHKALFEQHRLGALWADVCRGLDITRVDDLHRDDYIEKEDLA